LFGASAGRLAAARARALRLSNAEARRLETVLGAAAEARRLAAAETAPSRRAVYRYYRTAGEAGVDAVLLVLAETMAAYGPRLPHDLWQRHLETARTLLTAWWEQHDEVVAPPPLLSGHEVMTLLGLPPGPRVGQALEALREAQAAGEVTTREQAEAFLRAWRKR